MGQNTRRFGENVTCNGLLRNIGSQAPCLPDGDVFIIDVTGVDFDAHSDHCERAGTCRAHGTGYPAELWWSKIRRANGNEAWVREPIQNLDRVLRSD